MHDDYLQFLLQKIPMATFDGYEIDDSDIHALLKPHQRACVKWAVKGGNRALFESFGLGKSLQHVYDYEHHVKIGEDLDFRGALPSSFMSMAPGSHRDDCWHDINRMLTLNTAQQKARAMLHVCRCNSILLIGSSTGTAIQASGCMTHSADSEPCPIAEVSGAGTASAGLPG